MANIYGTLVKYSQYRMKTYRIYLNLFKGLWSVLVFFKGNKKQSVKYSVPHISSVIPFSDNFWKSIG